MAYFGKQSMSVDVNEEAKTENIVEIHKAFKNKRLDTTCQQDSANSSEENERRRWESNPRNNGFANRRLGPLGYAAKFFDSNRV
jgi:hypothetical protein